MLYATPTQQAGYNYPPGYEQILSDHEAMIDYNLDGA